MSTIDETRLAVDEIMKSPQMTAILDELSIALLGRSKSVAVAGKSCVSCGGRAEKFVDALSETEYSISGLCQECQDKTFNSPEE